MADRLRVCVMLEGSYPFITGGVSAWVQDIIKSLPEIDFCLFTISPQENQPLRYVLPDNVVEHKDIVLSRKHPKKKARRGARAGFVKEMLVAHARMFADQLPDMKGFLGALPVGYDLGSDLLSDDRAWNLLVRMNQLRNPAYAFSDYFWAWQASHRMLFEAMREVPPAADIYHAISTGFAGLAALAAKVRYGKPFLLSEHGLYHKEREIEIRKANFIKGYQRDMWIKVYNRISEICYRKADRISALFEENRQKQLELGAPPEACIVIQNGIDIERFSSVVRAPRSGFHVGLVGRVVPIKDIKTFITTAKIVLDRIPEATFYAIGPTDEDPEYYADCVALTESLHITDRFIFTGRQNVLEYYGFLDLMLLTSIREAQPLVIMEGWAAGVPSVCTKVGNVPEMLDYDDRFLSPSKDPVKLAECTFYVHDHPEEMRLVNERNRQKVFSLYDKKDMIARYRELYESIKGGA